ncbi:MAG: AAA family ATPase [Cyanobacteriota/Melainabacteria group bacterium]
MRIKEINISGYRSLRSFTIHPGPVTVCVGPNGSGKSNIYNALRLLKAAAAGEFARSIVTEGGMDSIFWAGERTEDETGKIKIGLRTGAMSYSMRFGIMPVSERSSDGRHGRGLDYFKQDPDIKFEQVEFMDRGKAIPLLRENSAFTVIARNMEGRSIPYALPLESGESVLSALREPQKFPELFKLRQDFLSWRFYHDFRTDLDSPIRKPQKATMTSVLSDNGHDLTSAIATIWAVGDERFDSLIDLFPGAEIDLDEEDGVLDIAMVSPGLYRKVKRPGTLGRYSAIPASGDRPALSSTGTVYGAE